MRSSIIIFVICSVLVGSCTKSEVLNSQQILLDSVIMGSRNLKFMYDAQGRVIKERLVISDTLKMENTFFYNGMDSSPYMKSHLSHHTSGHHFSYFKYNNSGDKVFDSTIYLYNIVLGENWRIVVNIDYSINGKIVVKQKVTPQGSTRIDTLYINNSGNTDSVKQYVLYSNQPLVHFGTVKPIKFNSIPNHLRTLSISRCKFYQPEAFVNPASYAHSYNLEDFQLAFDYFNSNYIIQLQSFQKSIQFNSNNLPSSHTLTPNPNLYPVVRYIYK
jgi:hypothetical protein